MAMNEGRFFKGLIASLAAHTRFIDARDDRHQAALDKVVTLLRELQASGEPGSAAMPTSLRPGPITGKYDAFDDALLNLQDLGYDSAQNPFYSSVELNLRDRRAERVLSKFSAEERRIFDVLARAFLESDLHQSA